LEAYQLTERIVTAISTLLAVKDPILKEGTRLRLCRFTISTTGEA